MPAANRVVAADAGEVHAFACLRSRRQVEELAVAIHERRFAQDHGRVSDLLLLPERLAGLRRVTVPDPYRPASVPKREAKMP